MANNASYGVLKHAHYRVSRAILSGVLVRPNSCARCGRTCRPEGHHEDYGKPLEVQWLCPSCHHKPKNKMEPKKLKLPRGLQARVARGLGVAAATVCQVAAGTRTSAAISAAIARELAKLKGGAK